MKRRLASHMIVFASSILVLAATSGCGQPKSYDAQQAAVLDHFVNVFMSDYPKFYSALGNRDESGVEKYARDIQNTALVAERESHDLTAPAGEQATYNDMVQDFNWIGGGFGALADTIQSGIQTNMDLFQGRAIPALGNLSESKLLDQQKYAQFIQVANHLRDALNPLSK